MIIDIFCDASISTTEYNETIGCAMAIALDRSTGQELDRMYDIRRASTNNNSEIAAISLAVDIALKFNNPSNIITIFSDSNICVKGLTEWIYGWNKKIVNNLMISSSNEPVANQLQILTVVRKIVYNNLALNILHQKGHVYSNAQLVKAKHTFAKSNNINEYDVSDEFIKYISAKNDEVDCGSREYLIDYINYNVEEKLEQAPISPYVIKQSLKEYGRLIKRRKEVYTTYGS